jgi:hypothetical protein
MALMLVVAVVCWLGICVLAVGLCVSAKRGDADLSPALADLGGRALFP